ncbi:MAG: hypothetical protein Q7S86_04525 [bacterium]|nr:hypothetical protein [bacterium]
MLSQLSEGRFRYIGNLLALAYPESGSTDSFVEFAAKRDVSREEVEQYCLQSHPENAQEPRQIFKMLCEKK